MTTNEALADAHDELTATIHELRLFQKATKALLDARDTVRAASLNCAEEHPEIFQNVRDAENALSALLLDVRRSA